MDLPVNSEENGIVGRNVVFGWETFFCEVQSLIRCSETRIDRADREFSSHIIDRLQLAIENIAAIHQLLSSTNELGEYCGHIRDLIEAIREIIRKWELHVNSLDSRLERLRYRIEREYSGSRGRPKFHVCKDQLVYLRELAFSWTKIASLLGISRVTVYRRRRNYHLLSQGEVIPSDEHLQELVKLIRLNSPDVGQSFVQGRLRGMGYRVTRKRIREVMRMQDPLNNALRMPSGLTARMKYSVPGPNSLWHIGKRTIN